MSSTQFSAALANVEGFGEWLLDEGYLSQIQYDGLKADGRLWGS